MPYRIAAGRLAVLCVLLLWSGLWLGSPTHSQAAAQSVVPRAMLVIVEPTTQGVNYRVHVDLGEAVDVAQTWQVPAGAQVQMIDDSPLPDVVSDLMVPSKTRRLLRFDGKPTAAPAPTLTPYVRGTTGPAPVVEFSNQTVVIAPVDRLNTQHRFAEVTCATCDATWILALVNQLPMYAPIVVFADGVVDWPDLWRIQALPVAETTVPALGSVVTLFERTADVSALPTVALGMRVSAQPPERFVEADGRTQLLRFTVCLVGVLLCSLAGFYLAVAVMRRMHAAVGYRPEDR